MKNILPLSAIALATAALLLLSACSHKTEPAASTGQKPANEPNDKSAFSEKRAAGVDFYAVGTEPFWSFELDYDEAMRFILADGETLRAPVGMGQMKDGALTYEAPAGSKNGRLRVVIKKEKCSDGMSDRNYDYSVQVTAKDQTYKGCGVVLAASPAGYWTLEKFNGKPVDAAAYHAGLPHLQLHLKENNYGGSDGCNSLRGTLKHGSGNSLTLGDAVSTKMACAGDAWQQFSAALPTITAYKLDKNKLILLADKQEVMVFRSY